MNNKKIFGNSGILDITAITTFGISSKPNANAIGKFGTGLKYAIAVMAREGLDLYIQAGETCYTFHTVETEFRGKEFEKIVCRVQQDCADTYEEIALPFTTLFGQNWTLAQVYRELASNAMDEGGGPGEQGETTIYADLDVDHFDVFRPSSDLIFENDRLCIYEGQSNNIYYQDIAVYSLDKPSMYTYSLKHCDLTEDRTLSGLWNWQCAVSNWVAKNIQDEQVVKWFIIDSDDSFLEGKLDMAYCSVDNNNVSDAFRAVMKKNQTAKSGSNNTAYNYYYSGSCGSNLIPKVLSIREQHCIDQAKTLLSDAGYNIDIQISVSEHLGITSSSRATDEVIWLSTDLLLETNEKVAAHILWCFFEITRFEEFEDYPEIALCLELVNFNSTRNY